MGEPPTSVPPSGWWDAIRRAARRASGQRALRFGHQRARQNIIWPGRWGKQGMQARRQEARRDTHSQTACEKSKEQVCIFGARMDERKLSGWSEKEGGRKGGGTGGVSAVVGSLDLGWSGSPTPSCHVSELSRENVQSETKEAGACSSCTYRQTTTSWDSAGGWWPSEQIEPLQLDRAYTALFYAPNGSVRTDGHVAYVVLRMQEMWNSVLGRSPRKETEQLRRRIRGKPWFVHEGEREG
ncbi:hypothetical protein VTK73DRAFT_348 [Phialemonium thermophilum]|uniref:Uncharacterized protein n=1 Tax=Phialemonium thermophilum TaxID=223376 RepID=A0ABR3VVM8_9PEZI